MQADGTLGKNEVLEVDIATRVVRPDEDFYIVRPGKSFSLYESFNTRSAVFLDFPDLDVHAFRAARTDTLRREMVQRSIEIQEWHQRRQTGKTPSRDLRDYAGKTYRARLGRYTSAISKLFFELSDQTIIIVPGPGSHADVLIGVLSGGANEFHDFAMYPGDYLPGRTVRWLGRRPKAFFSKEAREKLGNPHPVMLLDRSLREEFLRVAYDQFVINDVYTARFRTESDDYSSLDNEDITAFVNYVAGMIGVLEINNDGKIASAEEAIDLLREYRDRVPELSVNINSPGWLRLFSPRTDPVTIAVIMAVALAGMSPSAAQSLDVVNSAGAQHDACALVVSDQAKGAMSLMNFDDYERKRGRLTKAARCTHLQSTMKVRTRTKPS